MRVGFVGLGAMGRPMAGNVVAGGHQLTVYDTEPAAVAALSAAGAVLAPGYRELARSSELVVTMLPTPADVESVVLGADGLGAGLDAGSTLVDMSTGDPYTAQRLAHALEPAGVRVVDCPVGRTQAHAEAGTLLLLAGGDDAAIERVRPVLMCMGDELVRCGGHGTGQAMKLVNNMLSLIVTEGVAEALGLGLRAGLSLDLIEAVTAKTAASTAQMNHGLPERAFGDLTPGFALRLAEKDMALVTALADRLGVALPVAERTRQCCVELSAAGHADEDVAALVAARTADAQVGAEPAAGERG